MYILYNKYIIGLFLCIFIPLFSFTQEVGFSFNYNRTTMLSDLQFNEKIDVSFSPSISINFAITNTRLDLIYGTNEFTRTNYTFNPVPENSENDLYDVNLNMANSFISFNVNQQVYSFKRAKFLIGSGLTYGKVNFFRNLYNNQGYLYEIVDGNYSINNQLVTLDDNFETKVGNDSYYGINFNSEIDFKMDDKLYFIAGVDYVYNLSDNLDLRKETLDYDKQNDRFYSVKLGIRYLISNSSSKSDFKKIDSQTSLSNSNSEKNQKSLNDDLKKFTLNIPPTLNLESDTNSTYTLTKDVQSEDLPPTKFDKNCIYFVVDTLVNNTTTGTIILNDNVFQYLYCTESLIEALNYIKSNNSQHVKIINTENDFISDEYVFNDANHNSTINSSASKDIVFQEELDTNFIETPYDQSISRKTKKMYLDKDVDSLDFNTSPTFFVIIGVFSNEKNAKSHLNNKLLVEDNYFKRNNLFYCFAYSSNLKSEAINFKLNNPYESWIYERK